MHRPRNRLLLLLAATLALLTLGGCAVRGVATRALESKPVIRCYEKMGSEAKESRSQAEGCPACVY